MTTDNTPLSLSLGQRLCEAFQAARPPSGWMEPLAWDNFDSDGKAQYERAAVSFVAKLSDAPAELGPELQTAEDRIAELEALEPWWAAAAEAEVKAHEITRQALVAAEQRNAVLEGALEEARDMLLERVHGNPARSSGHNARLVIDAALLNSTTSGPTHCDLAPEGASPMSPPGVDALRKASAPRGEG